MNHSFKSVFNRRTGTWQVTSEKTRSACKTGNMVSKPLLAMLLGLYAGAGIAQSSPIDGGNTETITATSGTWNVGSGLTVGSTGVGILNIKDGGKVTNTFGYIGQSAGSHGTATVTGPGSLWQNSDLLVVGRDGTGTLNITAGGKVTNTTGVIGHAGNGNGTATVTGPGSVWENSGDLYVGQYGTGILNITAGGKVTNTFGYIGQSAGSHGTATVTGPDSVWQNRGYLYVGYTGTGTLNIEDGGLVTSNTVLLGGYGISVGTLNLNGTSGARGILSTAYLAKGTGTATFNWNGGILQATGAQSNFLQNFVSSNITIGSEGAYFDTNGYNVGITTAGLLTGVGGLTKQGGGVLTIAGSNTYSGNTTVSQGTLKFGSYNQSVSQTLGIGVASASNYGKLDITGIATFNTNAKLNVEVASVPTLANGTILTDVIRAGTLNANGFNVTDNSALFNFEAIQNANSVDLKVSANSSGGIRTAVTEGGQWSALGAASVLDAQVNNGATGDMGTVVTALGQLSNNRDVARATAQTLPVISGNQAVQGALSTFQNLVQNRNSNRAGPTGLSGGDAFANKNAWGKVFGSRAEQDNRSGAAGFTADTWGLALGSDAEVAPGARFGMAYGYAKTSVEGNTDLSGAAQRANIDSHVISAYGSKDIGGNRTFSFQGDIGLNDSKSTRYINFGGLSRTARADYRTYNAHVGAAIAQAFELNEKTTLTPALRADYTWLKSQSYSESGADALNLNVGSNKTDAFVIGADTYLQHRFSKTSRLDANFGVGYDVINKQGNIVAAYAGAPGLSFVTTGIDHSPWLVRGGIGYSMLASSGTEVAFRYDAEGRSDYLNHTASVRAKWAF